MSNYSEVLRRRNHCLHLVRIGAFEPVRLNGCGYVIVGLTGLNRTVAVIHRGVHGRINLRERPCAGSRAVHVISGDRCRCARIPRQIDSVLDVPRVPLAVSAAKVEPLLIKEILPKAVPATMGEKVTVKGTL